MNKQDFEQAFRLFKKSSVSDKKELLITFTELQRTISPRLTKQESLPAYLVLAKLICLASV